MLPPNQKCVRLWKGWSSISADAVVDAPGILALQVSPGQCMPPAKPVVLTSTVS